MKFEHYDNQGRLKGGGSPAKIEVYDADGILKSPLQDVMVGDSGAGGTQGLVPAPAAGDAAAGKFLKADATWAAPSGGAGTTQYHAPAHGRLTLESGVPVSVTNQLAKTTLYYTPYCGNKIALYSDGAWADITFAELSIAVPATTNTMYDVFIYNNAGTATLELLAWTNDTTRATALTYQDGVLVKSGDATRRYVGSFRTTGTSGQTEDSHLTADTPPNLLVWNVYNQVRRYWLETIGYDWTYNTASWRQLYNSANYRVNFVRGLETEPVLCKIAMLVYHNAGNNLRVAFDLDGSTGPVANSIHAPIPNGTSEATYLAFPGVGYHYLQAMEQGNGATSYFLGINGGADQSALYGWIWG